MYTLDGLFAPSKPPTRNFVRENVLRVRDFQPGYVQDEEASHYRNHVRQMQTYPAGGSRAVTAPSGRGRGREIGSGNSTLSIRPKTLTCSRQQTTTKKSENSRASTRNVKRGKTAVAGSPSLITLKQPPKQPKGRKTRPRRKSETTSTSEAATNTERVECKDVCTHCPNCGGHVTVTAALEDLKLDCRTSDHCNSHNLSSNERTHSAYSETDSSISNTSGVRETCSRSVQTMNSFPRDGNGVSETNSRSARVCVWEEPVNNSKCCAVSLPHACETKESGDKPSILQAESRYEKDSVQRHKTFQHNFDTEEKSESQETEERHANSSKTDLLKAKKSQSSLEVVDPFKPPPTYQKGVVPRYLRDRQEEWQKEDEEKRLAQPDPACPPGHVPMPEIERLETLKVLQKNYAELIHELNLLPVGNDTLRIRTRKMELEKKLAKIEEGIKIFSRQKVFIKPDA